MSLKSFHNSFSSISFPSISFSSTSLPPSLSRLLYLLCLISGVLYNYIHFSIVQEKIYKTLYIGKVYFKEHLFIIFVSCVGHTLLSYIIVRFNSNDSSNNNRIDNSVDKTPFREYMKVAVAYVLSIFFSTTSLSYVTYPTLILTKTIKILPVLLMGSSMVNYRMVEIVSGLVISLGVLLYFSQEMLLNDTYIGMLLLIGSLISDGFIGPKQDSMKKIYNVSSIQLMFGVNYASCILISPVIIRIFNVYEFIVINPEILYDILQLVLYSCVGQLFVFTLLHAYGSILLTIVTTTRKFTTIVLALWNKEVNMIQVTSILMVFIGTIWNIYDNITNNVHHKDNDIKDNDIKDKDIAIKKE